MLHSGREMLRSPLLACCVFAIGALTAVVAMFVTTRPPLAPGGCGPDDRTVEEDEERSAAPTADRAGRIVRVEVEKARRQPSRAARSELRGTVRANDDGRPIAGARVDVVAFAGSPNRADATFRFDPVTSSADGRFRVDLARLDHLTPLFRRELRFRIHSSERDHGDDVMDVEPAIDAAGRIRATGEITLLPVAENSWFHGRVVTPDGGPVAGAEVLWFGEFDERTTADQDGRFAFWCDHELIGDRCWLVARDPRSGLSEARAVPRSPPGHVQLGDLVLTRGLGTIRGMLAHADGTPIPDQAVVLTRSGDDEPIHVGQAGLVEATVRTDPDGFFRAVGMRPGRYEVDAWQDIENNEVTSPTVVAETDGPPIALVLRRARVDVEVVDAQGRPLPRARIHGLCWSGDDADLAESSYRRDGAIPAVLIERAEYRGGEGSARVLCEPAAFFAYEVTLERARVVHDAVRATRAGQVRRIVLREDPGDAGIELRVSAPNGALATTVHLEIRSRCLDADPLPLPLERAADGLYVLPEHRRVPLSPGPYRLTLVPEPLGVDRPLLPVTTDLEVRNGSGFTPVRVVARPGVRLVFEFVEADRLVFEGGGFCGNPYHEVWARSSKGGVETEVELRSLDATDLRPIEWIDDLNGVTFSCMSRAAYPPGSYRLELHKGISPSIVRRIDLQPGCGRFRAVLDRAGSLVDLEEVRSARGSSSGASIATDGEPVPVPVRSVGHRH